MVLYEVSKYDTLMKGDEMMNSNEIKAHMRRHGDTNAALAEALDMSPSTLSLKICGKSDFTAGEIKQIAKRYELTAAEICAAFFSA